MTKEEKYGITKADMNGLTAFLTDKNVLAYFDFEEYGREDDLSGYVELYENGYIDRSAMDEVNLHYYSLDEIKEELEFEDRNNKIKVVFKEVGKDPVVMEIEDTLEAKQKLVEGLIEVVPYNEDLLLICNEEGKITNLKPNLKFDYDYIAGNCFIVGDDFENEGFKSIRDDQIEDVIKDLKERSIDIEEIDEMEVY